MTPKQKAALVRGTKIRTLCMMYTVANGLMRDKVLTTAETVAVTKIMDEALIRVRGESETAKRRRERDEAWRGMFPTRADR